ncbi:response regulator [Breoghania sp.]|uniref:response regulator n=1 Tax=Breoghania sp. TaxID=2065378 RepID=UPI0026251D86|nr:response regulator [Breoghania sp.]MDJ0933464.1 response regulator [Breoghania sp.]
MAVFVIVKDASLSDALVLMLEQFGYDVVEVDDASAFVAGPPPEPGDTVVVDMNLQNVIGPRIVRWVNSLPTPLPSPKLVAFSGQSRDEIARRLTDLEIPVLLRMPFSAARLTPWL